jgi:hypothetical protein
VSPPASHAALVLELAVDRQAELADGGALRRDPELGIARQVADQENFVEIGHGMGGAGTRFRPFSTKVR